MVARRTLKPITRSSNMILITRKKQWERDLWTMIKSPHNWIQNKNCVFKGYAGLYAYNARSPEDKASLKAFIGPLNGPNPPKVPRGLPGYNSPLYDNYKGDNEFHTGDWLILYKPYTPKGLPQNQFTAYWTENYGHPVSRWSCFCGVLNSMIMDRAIIAFNHN